MKVEVVVYIGNHRDVDLDQIQELTNRYKTKLEGEINQLLQISSCE